MKTLVTGAGGFIASHLVEELVRQGREVRAFVRYNSRNSWGWLEDSPCRDAVEILSGDVRDYDLVASAVEGCETVFHLAALTGIPYSYVSGFLAAAASPETVGHTVNLGTGSEISSATWWRRSRVYWGAR